MYEVACEGKIKHNSKADALKHIRTMEKRNSWKPIKLKTYRCQYCKYWHIGHKV